jgi:glycosyltransferase involved in cell wall biosynthesis
MKILYLCADPGIPVLGRKGAAVHVRSMVGALRQAGHAVVVAAPVLNKSPWEAPACLDPPPLHLPPGPEVGSVMEALRELGQALGGSSGSARGELRRILYDRELLKQLRRRFLDDPPDLIYERASLYAMTGAELAGELRRPLLVELNAPLALEHTAYRAAPLGALAAEAERWTLARADAVLVVSAALREYVTGLGIGPERVHVVPNGVDPDLFRPGPPEPSVRARYGLREGPVLGFVGGLRPWHGVDVLPALLQQLVQRRADVQLAIVGEGPRRRALEEEVRARGLREAAVFTGALPHADAATLVRQFDVALAPYPRLEHAFYFSPLKLFEYLASGTAVVAARLGQIAEVVRDGETGLLYPPGDQEALAAACERLLDDPALRQRLGRAAAAEVRGRYTWDCNAARAVEIARSLQPRPEEAG